MKGRPSMDSVLMDIAHTMARRSTCSRIQVGTVIAVDGRVLSSGYNGAPQNLAHCDHSCDCGFPGEDGLLFANKHLSNCRSLLPCEVSAHAEANAVAFSAQYGIALRDSTLYTTLSPCVKCAQLIINAGVKAVVYDELYRDKRGVELLVLGGVATVCGVR